MSKRLLLLLPACLFLIIGQPRAARAQLTFFSTRTAFNTAFPGLPVEGFEKARIGLGGAAVIANPLDKTTNNTVFHTGEILDGLRVSSSGSHGGQELGLLAPNPIIGNTTVTPYNNFGGDSLDLTFYNNNVTSVGFDVLDAIVSNVPTKITIFGIGGVLLGTSTVNDSASGSFFGVSSTNVISRIDVLSSGPIPIFRIIGVDNVAFTRSGTAVPEPNGAALLLGLTTSAGLFLRYRNRR
jgi:hypothetical protein